MSNLEQYWEKDLEEADLKLDDLIQISNDILEGKDISDNEIDKYFKSKKGEEYDPDSSPIAWKYYKETNEWINEDVNMKEYTSSGITRICGSIKKDDNSINAKHVGYEKYKYIDFAGDCVFNFKEGGKTDINIIEKDLNLEYKRKLKICRAMQHSPYNFSLIPKTGGMNNRKNDDRPDWLLAEIKNLYEKCDKMEESKKIKELIIDKREFLNNLIDIKGELSELQGKYKLITAGNDHDIILFNFLMQIGSVEEYAKIFLNLDSDTDSDKKMVEAMIESGKKEIKSADDLNQYMDLAIRYWTIQKEKYSALKNKE